MLFYSMKSRTKLLANKKWKLNLFIPYLLRYVRALFQYYILYFNTKVILFFNHARKRKILKLSLLVVKAL